MTLIDAGVKKSRTTLSILVLVLVTGLTAYINIPKEAEPDINVPIMYVSMTHEGISPEDADRLLIKPMEKELKTIEGVKEVRSNASLGYANVLLEFEAGFDSDKAVDNVREKVDTAKIDLPIGTEEPVVHEVNLSLFPVIIVSLGGDVPERTLLTLGRKLRDRIETIPTVLEANIAGDRDEMVEIIIDPMRVESYSLDARKIIEQVQRSNQLVAAGSLDTGTGRFSIKVPGLFENMQDILSMPLKVNGDVVVRIRDVAVLNRTFKDRQTFARVNGKPSISIEVTKRSGENIIETIQSVRSAVENTKISWPEGVKVTYSQDKSRQIQTMLQDLQNNVTSAVLLVMIVVVGALGVRSGLMVGVAIPASFLSGILVLAMLGFTVNIVVLFALILSVGMLVDGAIVVVELADRKMCEGTDKKNAYIISAKRMAWPITASTATTLAAFCPLLFWPGLVGEFMKFLPITLMATLAASLLMALLFIPTLGTIFGRPGKVGFVLSESSDPFLYKGLTGRYVTFLNFSLQHYGKVLVLSIGLLAGVWASYLTFGKGIEFFPKVEPDQAILQIFARGNLSVKEMDEIVSEIEENILQLQTEKEEIASVSLVSGIQHRRDDTPEDIIGIIRLEFTDWGKRRPADIILNEIIERTRLLAGIHVETRKQEAGPPIGKPIQLLLTSNNTSELTTAVAKIRTQLERMNGIKDIEDSRPVDGLEWEITVDRAQAAKFSADIASIGAAIKLVTKGLKFDEFRPNNADKEIDIVARYPANWRSINQLDQIRIQTNSGLIPISNFVSREPKKRTSELRRVNGTRAMVIKADIVPGYLADDKVVELKKWLANNEFGSSVRINFKGEDVEQKKAETFLSSAFGIALFIMAIILVTQFNSFYSTFLILTSVIMSTIGVMLGLLAISQPFSIVMSGIGIISLAGVVVNNNIVLIDTFDRIVKEVVDTKKAILLTGAQRLRPVLLTAITTILGVMPMVMQINIDFIGREISHGAPSTQWWVQISTAIAFGLAFATILTLIVTPCALMARPQLLSIFRLLDLRK